MKRDFVVAVHDMYSILPLVHDDGIGVYQRRLLSGTLRRRSMSAWPLRVGLYSIESRESAQEIYTLAERCLKALTGTDALPSDRSTE